MAYLLNCCSTVKLCMLQIGSFIFKDQALSEYTPLQQACNCRSSIPDGCTLLAAATQASCQPSLDLLTHHVPYFLRSDVAPNRDT
jgi:hypothetical protein